MFLISTFCFSVFPSGEVFLVILCNKLDEFNMRQLLPSCIIFGYCTLPAGEEKTLPVKNPELGGKCHGETFEQHHA